MKEENTTCNMMEKLFNKSPLYQYPTQRFDVTGFFKGYRAFYMQKAAYLQALANLAITTYTLHTTLQTNDYDTWRSVQHEYGPLFNTSISTAMKYYLKGEESMWENMQDGAN